MSQLEVRQLLGARTLPNRPLSKAHPPQVWFSVPPGVEGCRGPVAVRVDGLVDHYATMAITSFGKTCSDPVSLPAAGMERLREKQDGKIAWILLNRLGGTLGSVYIRQDEGAAEIVGENLAATLASGSLTGRGSAPALGTCMVYTLPEPGASLVLEPENAEYRQPVDAGPASVHAPYLTRMTVDEGMCSARGAYGMNRMLSTLHSCWRIWHLTAYRQDALARASAA